MKNKDIIILGGLMALLLLKSRQAVASGAAIPPPTIQGGSFSQEVEAAIPANINQDVLFNTAIQLSGNSLDTSGGTLYVQDKGAYNVALTGINPYAPSGTFYADFEGVKGQYAISYIDRNTGNATIVKYSYAELPDWARQYA